MPEPTETFLPPVAPVIEQPDPAVSEAGHAHVTTASFLAARITPTGGFVVALAGGLALARVSERTNTRTGYGASLAAMLQNCAVVGPLRINIPLTQALSAPILGSQYRRGAGIPKMLATCLAIRTVHLTIATAFYVAVIVGGVDTYVDAYDNIIDLVDNVSQGVVALPKGQTAALVFTAIQLYVWTAGASAVQVLVYRKGLEDWPAEAAPTGREAPAEASIARPLSEYRFDPRAVAVCAIVAFTVLCISHEWILLGAVAVWLLAAWLVSRADQDVLKPGLILAAALGFGALTFGLIGGSGIEDTIQRTIRATLLVLVATWLRAAAGEEGLHEVFRRTLGRLRRIPPCREATAIIERLRSSDAVVDSGKTLIDGLKDVEKDIPPIARAVLEWVASEAEHFRTPPKAPRTALRLRFVDLGLTVVALVACATIVLPEL